MQVDGARGQTGTYKLELGKVKNTMRIMIGSEPQDELASQWGLTTDNRYTPAVLNWLLAEYGGYTPDDISFATFHGLSGTTNATLSLTEMYWLNIPPVHTAPEYGGSNIWFVAGMGSLPSSSGPHTPDVEPETKLVDGKMVTNNVYITATMMITNTATGDAWAPDRLNGVEYTGLGSSTFAGTYAWTSVVFSVTGALQKPGYGEKFLPLQQYVFTPDSFGVGGDPFLTRIKVMDPYLTNTMGYYYGWSVYRDVYPVWYRWSIEDNPDGRVSIVPLVPNTNTAVQATSP